MTSNSLLDPKYMGGLYSAGGHDFEVGYVLSQLPRWLSELSGLKSFLQEGWSDVELFFESGRRWLIQIKDHTVDKTEFKEIVTDFIMRENNSSGQYERYIIISTNLTNSLEKIQRSLKRLRDTKNSYPETELAGTRASTLKTLTESVDTAIANFIIERVYFENDLAWIKNEEQLRDTVVGQLIGRYKISRGTAVQYYQEVARSIIAERGHLIELAPLRRKFEIQKQPSADEQLKAQLIRDLCVTSEYAKRAISELRSNNWHADGSLRRAYLFEAKLGGTDLSDADFEGADLSCADLTDTFTQNTILRKADLRHAKFSGDLSANLSGADLRNAEFATDTNIWAILEQANLYRAEVEIEQLTRAVTLRGATMPDGRRYDGRLNLSIDHAIADGSGIDVHDPNAMAKYYEVSLEEYELGQQWAHENIKK